VGASCDAASRVKFDQWMRDTAAAAGCLDAVSQISLFFLCFSNAHIYLFPLYFSI